MVKQKLIFIVLVSIFLVAPCISSGVSTPSRIEALRQSILALDSAWTRANSDLQAKKQANTLSDSERKDYAKFITYLSSRMDYYCHLLKTEGGDEAATDLPCADFTGARPDTEQPPAMTRNEQVAALDKSLDEALGEFDEQLLAEEERLAGRTPAERESGRGYGGRGGAGGSGQHGPGQQGGSGSSGSTGNDQSQSTGTQGQGSEKSSSGAGAGSGTTSSEERDDPRTGTQEIESGYDDIVARQLREAAEKETDPELKKKLWEEYRKYKEGIQ